MRANLKEKEKGGGGPKMQFYRVTAGTVSTDRVLQMKIDALHMADAFNEFIKVQPDDDLIPDKVIIERVGSGLHTPFTRAPGSGVVWLVEASVHGVMQANVAVGANCVDVLVDAFKGLHSEIGAGFFALDSIMVERLDPSQLQHLTGETDVEVQIAEIEDFLKRSTRP